MATIKINCPNCQATGLVGDGTPTVCQYCKGIGTVTANDSDTITTISSAATTAGYAPAIVTVPTAIGKAALKVAGRGK